MKTVVILCVVAVQAMAADVTGTWKAEFTAPLLERPKMVSEIAINLKVDENKLTGNVRAGNWPGEGPLIDGKIDGDRISFTLVGEYAWCSRASNGEEACGLPKLIFNGTIQSGELQLTLTWDSVMLHGKNPGSRKYELIGKRVSN